MASANLEQLMMVVEAHPELVLEGEERATFAAEIPDLTSIEREHAGDAEALIYCAWAHRKLGAFEKALAAADRAIGV